MKRSPVDLRVLEQAARAAAARAHAPYSQFAVGAALEAEGGEIICGCNLENVSLGLGICAERVALLAAWARGLTPGPRMVIVTSASDPTPPCGACRDALRELAPATEIVSIGAGGRTRRWEVADLLTGPVDRPAPDAVRARDTIARKRDGERLAPEEIHALIRGLAAGDVLPYQMAAFMMAVYFRGMDRGEIRALTQAMLASGARLDLTALPGAKIDKHSTGGVGDKTSLPLVPLAMACGIRVPMISGRGLGHTGGTLDKLESISGFRTRQSIERLAALAADPGGFIAGQTETLVPADRLMYALRDVSATVESVPLIVSSILSKKLAAGLTGLVLDVKVGRGAFMSERTAAEDLARMLVGVAEDLGLPAVALLTRMDEPIGCAVGNALEVREALAMIRGETVRADFRELTLALGGLMAVLAGRARTMGEGARMCAERLRSGQAADCCRRWLAAQGASPEILDDPEQPPVSACARTLRATRDGWVTAVDALAAGRLCVDLGGGRRRMEDRVDPAVGLLFHRGRGDAVGRGDPLVTLHLPDGSDPQRAWPGEETLVEVGSMAPPAVGMLLGLITSRGAVADPWDTPAERLR